MVKHTQIIRRQKPTNYLGVFDHFVGLALKGLIKKVAHIVGKKIAKFFNNLRGNVSATLVFSKFFFFLVFFKNYPSKYLFKVNNRNRKKCEICSKLTINTPERRHYVFIINFRHLSQLFLVFLLLTVNR